jgi:FkbM family methyltransferase
MISYAQNLEDVALNRVFQSKPNGFYIDVGAYDPLLHSVTQFFHELGWRGINIEPVPANYERFVRARPRDVNLNVAVSDTRGVRVLHEVEDNSLLASLDPSVAQASSCLVGAGVRSYQVETRTLRDICEEHCRGPIDFLKIDTEGAEREAILGADWKRFRPTMLVVEATKPCSGGIKDWDNPDEFANWGDWEPLLFDAGYELVYFDCLNRYYVRKEDRGYAKRFVAPLNRIQDDFTLYSQTRENEELKGRLRDVETVLETCRPQPEFGIMGKNRDFAMIRIELINACEYSCYCCPRDKMQREVGVLRVEDLDLLMTRVEEFMGRPYSGLVHVCGFGEMLLDPDFALKVRRIKQRWPECFIDTITTLGYPVGERGIEELLAAGLDEMRVSFYGYTPESYRKVHGADRYALALENARALGRLKDKYQTCVWILLEEERNVLKIEGTLAPLQAFRELLDRENIPYRHRRLHNFGTGKKFNKPEHGEVCSVAWGKFAGVLTVNWNLDLAPCCLTQYNDEIILGNLRDSSLRAIALSDKYAAFIDAHWSGKLANYKHCNGCQHINSGTEEEIRALWRFEHLRRSMRSLTRGQGLDMEAYYHLGLELHKSGQAMRAREVYDRVAADERTPETLAAWTRFKRGELLLENGEPEDARPFFEESLRLDPNLVKAAIHLTPADAPLRVELQHGQDVSLSGNGDGPEKQLRVPMQPLDEELWRYYFGRRKPDFVRFALDEPLDQDDAQRLVALLDEHLAPAGSARIDANEPNADALSAALDQAEFQAERVGTGLLVRREPCDAKA